eukprot:TRINITY_DN812_c0_g1_i3.p1 TRINITY_DN812_c0_g1~~TRINITY_DN812_c0_g1_i3.p1  ORF type:complete len:182 (+),score=19.17 TRINITY_DN812_c0_g1_i3:41-547(+)
MANSIMTPDELASALEECRLSPVRWESLPPLLMEHAYFEVECYGKAHFRVGSERWTSLKAWATVRYNAITDSIDILKTWKQQAKKTSKYAEPRFTTEGKNRLRAFARKRWEIREKIAARPAPRDGSGTLINHEEALCERCQELGRNCTQRRGFSGRRYDSDEDDEEWG